MMDHSPMGPRVTNESPDPMMSPPAPSPEAATVLNDLNSTEDLTGVNGQSVASRAFSRRRRKSKKKTANSDEQVPPSPSRKDKSRPRKEKQLPKEDVDPYDSDPGESYRQHCLRVKGMNTKSCLRRPGFLKSSNANGDDTVATDPPSPLSEPEDLLNQTPVSLPPGVEPVRYSLRSAIGDGAAQQPQGPTVMERRELRPNGVHVNVSHWSDMGCRPYMEDRYVVEDMGSVQVKVSPVVKGSSSEGDVEVAHVSRPQRRLKMPLGFFGIFDGHGGEKASQYCADWMSSYVKTRDTFPHDLGFAMKNAFNTIDDDFVNTGYPDGTTACAVSLVGGRRIVCANAGDSRAIVVRKDGSVVRLSRDHKPGIPDETRRISELGGRVIYWGRWRVEGLLAVSRSVGDASLKPYVTAEPEVCEYDVGKDDWFLVISSDGVWDVMDNEEAAHVIIATSCVMDGGRLVIDTDRFKWASRNLCEHARSCGSTDNFSVICVDLQSCRSVHSTSGRYEPK